VRKFLSSVAIAISLCALGAIQTPAAWATTTQLGSLSIITVSLDQKTLTLTPPTSNSTGAWSVSLDNSAIASVNGLTLTLLGVGSGQLTFTQAATGAFTSASRTTVFRITPGAPTIAPWPTLTAPLTAGTFTIVPPNSNSTGTWSYSLSNNVVNGYATATLSKNIVTLQDGGSITISATQSATTSYNPATVTTTLLITATKPTVGPFADITVSRDSVGSFNLKLPSSNSPGAWSVTSSLPTIASVVGTMVTPIGVGTTVLTARQAPAGPFSSIVVTMNLTVTATAPTVGSWLPISYTLGTNSTNTLTLTPPTSNSSGPWVFTVADPTIATVSGNTLTLLKGGTTTISAQESASANFGISAPLSAPLKVSQSAIIPTLPNRNQVAGDPAIVITPPASQSSGGWSLTSSDPQVVAVNGLSLNLGNAGTATITLTQAADGFWLQNSTSFTVTVAGLVPTVGTLAPITITAGTTLAMIPNPTSNSSGIWSYTVSDPSIAKIVGGQLIALKPGVTTLSAVQHPAGKYGQSNTVQGALTVEIAAPTPSKSPMPSPSKSPMPSPSKSPMPTPTSKPKPKHSKAPVVPIVSAKVVGRSILVTSNNPKVVVMINGAIAKVGVNPLVAGNDLVIIQFDSKVIYSRVFAIK